MIASEAYDGRERARVGRLIERLRVAARDLDLVAGPGEAVHQRETLVGAFDAAMAALYRDDLLPDDATLRQVLAACGSGAARLTPLVWGQQTFIHQFLTREFVDALAAQFLAAPCCYGDAPVLEVGAGRGELARRLRARGVPIVATDDGSWLDGRLAWPRGVPLDVEPLSYTEALARTQPALVLCAWMPLAEDWTPAFRACPSVREYVLIGEGPGGCTGAATTFEAPAPWVREALPEIARHGFTRNADRAFSTAVYHFRRLADSDAARCSQCTAR